MPPAPSPSTRWIADAAAIHKATLQAASNEERGGEGGMGAHVATSALGSSPLLDVPAAVEDCWPRRTGADGVARGASGTGAKAQRGGGEKVSSAGARRFLHVLNPFRCGPQRSRSPGEGGYVFWYNPCKTAS